MARLKWMDDALKPSIVESTELARLPSSPQLACSSMPKTPYAVDRSTDFLDAVNPYPPFALPR